MNQIVIDFNSHKLARVSDPQTSHVAAARVREFLTGHVEVILAALQDHGPMTVDQIAARTRLASQQINKRLPEMERLVLVGLTGETRKSASGRPARVWTARV